MIILIPFYSGNSFSPPWSADQISAINSSYNPVGVKLDSYTLNYFRRDLMQRLMYFVDWQNLPEHWDKDYLNFALIGGYCGVIDGGEFGIIPQWGTLSGWGIYCQPTRLSVLNRFFQKPLMLIGSDCELLRLTPDWIGLWDVIDFYAVKLALVSRDFDMSAIQSTVSWAVAAKNKEAAVTIKAIYDKAQAGEPLIVYDKAAVMPNDPESADEPWQEFSRDVHDSLIFAECLDAMQNLYHQFDTVMGIPYASTAKKERTLTVEALATAGETQSRVQGFMDTLKRSCDRVNKMFDLNISVDMRGGAQNVADSDNEQLNGI